MSTRPLALVALAVILALMGCEETRGPRRDTGVGPGTDAPIAPGTDVPMTMFPDVPPRDAPRGAVDSDNDGLSDDDELARGTNPGNADTDGDGYEDGVEVLAGTNPLSEASFIPPTDFYVVLPYNDPLQRRELDFRARLGRADIFFLIDTTASMAAPIGNVTSSLSSTIVPAINDAIADAVMGVGDYRDFPVNPYGSPGDWPMIVRQPCTTDTAAVQAALTALRVGGGNDIPEAGTEGLYVAAAGTCAGAGFGGACFREMSHPIIVHVTDAPFHNGPVASNNYSGVAGAHGWTETLASLNAHDIKVVGIAVDPAPFPLPFPIPVAAVPDLESLATATGSRGFSGGLTVYTAPGGSVSGSAVDGIIDLVGAARQDVSSRNEDDPSDAVDATGFIQAITPLRSTRPTTHDATTFFGVSGGTTVTFAVDFRNDFQPPQFTVQIYRAYIEVFDVASGTALDRRTVYVVIPPEDGILF